MDQVSTFSKMHTFSDGESRVLCLLSSGNLATTQAVMREDNPYLGQLRQTWQEGVRIV